MYIVLAKCVAQPEDVIEYVAGEFSKLINARLFVESYSEKYQATCKIVGYEEID